MADTVHTKMYRTANSRTRVIGSINGSRKVEQGPQFYLDTAADVKEQLTREKPLEAFSGRGHGTDAIDVIRRRVCYRGRFNRLSPGASVPKRVSAIDPDTVELRDCLFAGEQTIIQRRADGWRVIENLIWIGFHRHFKSSDLAVHLAGRMPNAVGAK